MSNTYVIHDARLVDDAESKVLPSGETVVTLRLADNPPHAKDEKRPARFVRAKVWGKLGDSAAKLSKGDVISVTGELGREAYGDDLKQSADVMRVNAFRVHKSESFYDGQGPADDRPKETKGKNKGKGEDPFA